MKKLYIYDQTSEIDRDQADGRFDGEKNIDAMPVTSIGDLRTQLSQLVASNTSYDRILFQTHGFPGGIAIKKAALNTATLHKHFTGLGLDKIAGKNARIQFDGCNVAQGQDGWTFLETAGRIFLQSGGGYAAGWTSLGTGINGWIPWIGGHTLHFSGGFRRVFFDINGKVTGRRDSEEERNKEIIWQMKHNPYYGFPAKL